MERTTLPDEEQRIATFRVSKIVSFFTLINAAFYAVLIFVIVNYFQPMLMSSALQDANNAIHKILVRNFGITLEQALNYIFLFINAFLALQIVVSLYRLIAIKNTILFVDKQGVWLHTGVFSWQKEINGVFWADASMAKSHNSFTGMIFNAYPVTVLNRYTNVSEISVGYIAKGKEAINTINRIVEEQYNSHNAMPR